MAKKHYWRGYIDGQNKSNFRDERIAVAKKRKFLEPLANILDVDVEEYRSGFLILLPAKWEVKLPISENEDYLEGWFDAQGQQYKNKVTISGKHVAKFMRLAEQLTGEKFPVPQKPSKSSDSMRVTLTGSKAMILLSALNKS